MVRLEDCCTHCIVCGHAFCRDEFPSPFSDETCPECLPTEVCS